MSITLVFSDDAPIFNGSNKESYDFKFTVSTDLAGKMEHVTKQGILNQLGMPVLNWQISYNHMYQKYVFYLEQSPTTNNPVLISSSNKDVATFDQFGSLVYVSDGPFTITATDSQQGSVSASASFNSTYNSFTLDSFTFAESNDFVAHISANVDELISTYTPDQYNDAYFSMWSTFNIDAAKQTTPIATPNAASWMSKLDLSWMGVAKQVVDGTWAGVAFPAHLISPRHVAVADHVKVSNGDTLYFRKNTGELVSAVVVDHCGVIGDIHIAYIDQDLGIDPVLFPSEPYGNFMPSTAPNLAQSLLKNSPLPYAAVINQNTYVDIPVILALCNQFPANAPWETGAPKAGKYPWSANAKASFKAGWRHFSIYSILKIVDNTNNTNAGRESGWFLNLEHPYLSKYQQYSVEYYGGDSSSAAFIPVKINNVLKTMFVTTLADVFGGPDYSSEMTLIEQRMNLLSARNGDTSTYSLSKVDLSALGFKRYK